jgi:hypothetical protein
VVLAICTPPKGLRESLKERLSGRFAHRRADFARTAFEGRGQMIPSDVRIIETGLAAERLIRPLMEVSGGSWVLEHVER